MRSAGSAGSPDPESNSKPRVGSLTLASPLPQLADGHSPSTADGLVPLLVEMVKQRKTFSVWLLTCCRSLWWNAVLGVIPFSDDVFFVLLLLFPHGCIRFVTFWGISNMYFMPHFLFGLDISFYYDTFQGLRCGKHLRKYNVRIIFFLSRSGWRSFRFTPWPLVLPGTQWLVYGQTNVFPVHGKPVFWPLRAKKRLFLF